MNRIIDWIKLKDFIKKRKPVEVSAGLIEDWYFTADTVYERGKWIKKNKAFVHSNHATPGFKATMKNGDVLEVKAFREMNDEDLKQIELERKENNEKIRELLQEIRK